MFELTVLHAFGAYDKGHVIHDQDEVKRILASENAPRVIKVAVGTHSEVGAAVSQAVPAALPAPEPKKD